MAKPGSLCTFRGTAAGVSVRGEGRAVLVEPEAFANDARISLRPVSIDGVGPNVEIAGARVMLEPVGINPCDAVYEVTYSTGADPLVVVDISRGGADGGFQGQLAGAPNCANRPCAVVWDGDAKRIELHHEITAFFVLSGELPFGAAAFCGDAGVKTRGAVHEVTVRGAAGTLRCGDRDERLEGDRMWRRGDLRNLRLGEIRVDRGALQVTLENEAPPEPVAASAPAPATSPAPPTGSMPAPVPGPGPEPRPPWSAVSIVAPIAALLVVAALATALILRRRRPSSPASASAAQAPSDPRVGLTPEQLRGLADALLDAFPDEVSLKRMLRFRLGKNLAAIAGTGPLDDVVFHLLEVTEAEGWTRKLLAEARKDNQGNPKLAQIARDLGLDDPNTGVDLLDGSARSGAGRGNALAPIMATGASRAAPCKLPTVSLRRGLLRAWAP